MRSVLIYKDMQILRPCEVWSLPYQNERGLIKMKIRWMIGTTRTIRVIWAIMVIKAIRLRR